MKQKFFLMALLGLFCALASGAQTLPLKLERSVSLNGSDSYYALDKDGNILPVDVTLGDNGTEFTIYSDYAYSSIKKQFTLNDIYIGEKYSSRKGDLLGGIFSYFGIGAHKFGGSELNLTQNVFNKDDNWEIVITTYQEEYSYGVANVYNDEGKHLGTLPFEVRSIYGYVDFEYVNNEFYLIEFVYYDNGDGSMNFYTCDTNVAGAPMVLKEAGSRAYPNPLPAGHALTVELDAPADEATVVEVYDMAGRMVTAVNAKEGETKIYVPAHRLRNGNFVYVVKSAGEKIEQGKIIAK
ncbi:MAG: T9SS type A sorting domain-containing protein [Clostridium sp.]|nr:T9SS type A sorting domain-containing protein [Clostridium sp.]